MKVTRLEWDGSELRAFMQALRAPLPSLAEVAGDVAEIVSGVGVGGDKAVMEFERRFGGKPGTALRVPPDRVAAAPEAIPGEVADALQTAAENIRRVAEAEAMADLNVTLPQGHSIRLRSVAVESAGAYVPGGAGSYPSTALMCCIPARVAGVERIAVASPAGEGAEVDPVVLAACAIAEVDEVYGMGGAQAVAALALGTESVPPVDVVCGPGNRYVQEAKRQLSGHVAGIDGIAGPSELMVISDPAARADWLALDICAQAEHGPDGLLVAVAAEAETLDAIESAVTATAAGRDSVFDAPLALVLVPSLAAAVELANALAPEHLQLAGAQAEALAGSMRTAGCVFIGELGATAFGDYAAGSNHVLPTGGAGRFTGPLGPTVFRRRLATVEMTEGAARELAPTVATLARAEGFPVHGESVEARGRSASEAEERPD